ncbi:MAG: beta-N-acetylhexosaminidase [Phycisphaerales bacterium]|nr:beta-N-acetylhexosaminidase [Phycisphaerales bacterium]
MTTAAPPAELLAHRLLCVGFHGTTMSAALRDQVQRGVRAVALFARNYESPAQLRALCAEIRDAAEGPMIVAVDHEGGRVQRFREGFTAIPAMREVGDTASAEHAMALGQTMAAELAGVGVNLDFAPVLDVDTNPANPVIGPRSLGADPALVARLGCALLEGLQSGGVAACAKHFPGHGDTDLDTHFDLPRLPHPMDRLRACELVPFRAAIAAGVASIMTAHVVFPALDPDRPATMSPAVVDGLLRRELGFDGLVFTDDLEMKAVADHFGSVEAALAAVRAGCDLLCVCSDADLQARIAESLARAIADGALARQQVARAIGRADRVRARFSGG